MASLDRSQCPAVESVPGKISGAWVFKGTRMPVQTVFENLEAGRLVEEITKVFDVTPDEVKAVIRFATESLAKSRISPRPRFQGLAMVIDCALHVASEIGIHGGSRIL